MSPASGTMPPLVYAFTGLCRGIVTIRYRLVMTCAWLLARRGSRLLERTHGVAMIDSRNLRHVGPATSTSRVPPSLNNSSPRSDKGLLAFEAASLRRHHVGHQLSERIGSSRYPFSRAHSINDAILRSRITDCRPMNGRPSMVGEDINPGGRQTDVDDESDHLPSGTSVSSTRQAA